MAFNQFLIGKKERVVWIVETGYGSGGTLSSGEVVGLDVEIQNPDWRKGYQDVLSSGADNRNVQNKVRGPKHLPYTMQLVRQSLWLLIT